MNGKCRRAPDRDRPVLDRHADSPNSSGHFERTRNPRAEPACADCARRFDPKAARKGWRSATELREPGDRLDS
jgi:hypothetical protein